MHMPSANGASPRAIVVGAGHNGLVAALFLARAGYAVQVLEDKPVVGGAARTERPFARAPELATSTGAYLFGLMPPELLAEMGLDIPLFRRDPHYFLPTTDGRYLLFGSDAAETERQFLRFFSAADWAAHQALEAEMAELRADVGPSWLKEPSSVEETAERFVRRSLQATFVDLCRKPVGAYLDRFGFQSDLLKAMYAVTDGFSGLFGTWDTPGTGMNFLAHNMCRLPGSGGTWMIAKGGMGAVTAAIADGARKAGARIETDAEVVSLILEGREPNRQVRGVVLASGKEVRADVVVCNADPFRLQRLVGRSHLPALYNDRIDGYLRDGTTFKLNLALSELPEFTCLPQDRGQFGPTIHLLPDERDVLAKLREAFEDTKAGRLSDFPTIEWYIHTTVDPSLRDSKGHHNSALFVQWVPYELAGTTWEKEEPAFVKRLLSICDRFAPGTSDRVVDTFALNPRTIESHFGISRGHIHHVDNSFGFDERLPYRTPIGGLYACSAGCHPGGGVIGAAGHNAARRIIRDLA